MPERGPAPLQTDTRIYMAALWEAGQFAPRRCRESPSPPAGTPIRLFCPFCEGAPEMRAVAAAAGGLTAAELGSALRCWELLPFRVRV